MLAAVVSKGQDATHRCMVTPHARRSFTRRTLLMTSLPRLSNIRTFHIGSPSSFSMGAVCEMDAWFSKSDCCGGVWFRFRTLVMESTSTP